MPGIFFYNRPDNYIADMVILFTLKLILNKDDST